MKTLTTKTKTTLTAAKKAKANEKRRLTKIRKASEAFWAKHGDDDIDAFMMAVSMELA